MSQEQQPIAQSRIEDITLSIVIPCYNEECVLKILKSRLTGILKQMYLPYEVIMVDDGSSDRTWQMITAFSSEDNRFRGVRLSRNYGHQLALSCGLGEVNGDVILILDADLQDPPELLPEMLKILLSGADVVYGVRRTRAGVNLVLRMFYHGFYKILSMVAGCVIPAQAGDFRLMSRRVVDVINKMPESDRFLRGMVSWIGFKQIPFEYDRDARVAGNSKYSFSKLARLAMDGLLNFSIKPLRIASVLSVCLGLLAVLMVGYLIYNRITNRVIEGWTSMIVVSLVVGALQLFVLGVIGEYLGRLFIHAKGRPLYIVEERTGGCRETNGDKPMSK